MQVTTSLPEPIEVSLSAIDAEFSATTAIYRSFVRSVLRSAPIAGAVAAEGSPTRTTPGLVYRATQLAGAEIDEAEARADVRFALEHVGQELITSDSFAVAAVPAWLSWGMDRVTSSLDAEHRVDVLGHPDPDWAERVSRACDQLRRSAPALGRELDLLISSFVSVTGPVRSATESGTFGAIYLNVRQPDGLATVLDIVHELSHHLLDLRQRVDPLLTNPDALGQHPLRPDPRPLNGVLHAGFVSARTLAYLDGLPPRLADDYSWSTESIDVHREQARSDLRDIVESLEPTAQWTHRGRRFARALRDAAQ